MAVEKRVSIIVTAKNAASNALGRIKGAVLSLQGAIAGVSFALITRQLFQLATDAEETASKFNTVFGDSAEKLDEVATAFGRFAGMSRTESRKILGTLGGVAQGMGMAQAESAAFAEQLFRLSADLGSFNNLSTQDVSERLTAALTGERDSMKRLGIVFTEVDVQRQAMLETGKKEVSQLTQLDKAYATLSLSAERAGVAVGDVERTSGSLANQSKRVRADLVNIAEDIAARLVPAFEQFVKLIDENSENIAAMAEGFVGIGAGLAWLIQQFRLSALEMGTWGDKWNRTVDRLRDMNALRRGDITPEQATQNEQARVARAEAIDNYTANQAARILGLIKDEVQSGGVFQALFGREPRSSGAGAGGNTDPNAIAGTSISFRGGGVRIQDFNSEAEGVGDAREYWAEWVDLGDGVSERWREAQEAMRSGQVTLVDGLTPISKSIDGLNEPVDGIRAAFAGVAGEVGRAADAMGDLNAQVAGAGVDLFMRLGDAMTAAFTAMVTGATSAGKAFKQAMLGAISTLAKSKGDFFMAEALGAIAQGILGGKPNAFAAAAKFGLAASAMYAVAGFAGGAAYGGAGGAGGFSAQDLETRSIADTRQEAVVVIEGGFLDMSDPRQEEQFVRALESLSGRRVTVRSGG